MMLLTTPECDPCNKIKQFILEENIDIEIKEIKKINGKYEYEGITISSFPVLYFGTDTNGSINYVMGFEGVKSYLEYGYIYATSGKRCPYLNKECIGSQCAKFTILYKSMIPEGACSDYWSPILMTELIRGIKNVV